VTATPRRGKAAGLAEAWLRLNVEQRVAAVASILLIVSTFGPFSFVELAEILAAAGVLVLLKQRADGREFHLPFGDGTVIFAAGVWCGLLIATRFLDRPLGLSVLAMVCALLLAAAGLRERAKRAPDDLPAIEARPRPARAQRVAPSASSPAPPERPPSPPRATPAAVRAKPKRPAGDSDPTQQLSFDEDATVALPEQPPLPEPPSDERPG
jgi:hypothetical protein